MRLHGEWLVLAERVIQDAYTNALTLVSCLDQVTAVRFPAQHHGFGVAARYRVDGEPPKKPTRVRFRLLRVSEVDPEETLSEFESVWEPGTQRSRIAVNFQFLRLKRAETLCFRVDHKVGNAAWQRGPSCMLDVVQVVLTPEEREAALLELRARGLPTTDLES